MDQTYPKTYNSDLSCPSGWKSYGTDCYKLYEEELSWDDAMATCQQNHQVNDRPCHPSDNRNLFREHWLQQKMRKFGPF